MAQAPYSLLVKEMSAEAELGPVRSVLVNMDFPGERRVVGWRRETPSRMTNKAKRAAISRSSSRDGLPILQFK